MLLSKDSIPYSSDFLVSWLGRTDVQAGQGHPDVGLGPVAQALEHKKYNRLVLLNNYPPGEATSFHEWIASRNPQTIIDIRQVNLSGPTSYKDIFQGALSVLQDLSEKHLKARLTFSSGFHSHQGCILIIDKGMKYPHGIRASAHAGEKLENGDLVLEGKREAFFSIPSHSSLIQLVKEAEKHNKRESELSKAIDHLSAAARSDSPDKFLLVKTLLMTGRIKDSFSFAGDADKVGWSYQNHGGVLFSSILYLAGRMNEDCSVTDSLLEDYAGDVFFDMYDIVFPDDFDVETECCHEIKYGLAISNITAEELDMYFKWAVNLGEKRIRHIVSNKYRKAYNRAARVLVALAETFAARDKNAEASAILKKYYHKLFNRFAAFRSEIKGVLAMSDILKNRGIGV